VIVCKWRIVLGGLAAASFLGTFAAGPALASTASPGRVLRVPVIVSPAAPGAPALTGVVPAVGGNLAGVPVLGALLGGVPALPDAGALLGDLNGLVSGAGVRAGG
jgi:hypothetical protein